METLNLILFYRTPILFAHIPVRFVKSGEISCEISCENILFKAKHKFIDFKYNTLVDISLGVSIDSIDSISTLLTRLIVALSSRTF